MLLTQLVAVSLLLLSVVDGFITSSTQTKKSIVRIYNKKFGDQGKLSLAKSSYGIIYECDPEVMLKNLLLGLS